MKKIYEELAYAIGRKDEGTNIDLEEKIAKTSNKEAVKELIELTNDKKGNIRHDAIKVLYETGERNPELIIPFKKVFLEMLNHSDNCIKWGSMSALYAITKAKPELLANHLTEIVDRSEEHT